jgi:hypothetical protein
MSYTGKETAKAAREILGNALAELQSDPEIPKDVLDVTEGMARAIGALFEAENASSEVDGKAGAKAAVANLSQTLALLQDVRSSHAGIGSATAAIAGTIGQLFPLTTMPSAPPPSPAQPPEPQAQPTAAEIDAARAATVQLEPGAQPTSMDRTLDDSNAVRGFPWQQPDPRASADPSAQTLMGAPGGDRTPPPSTAAVAPPAAEPEPPPERAPAVEPAPSAAAQAAPSFTAPSSAATPGARPSERVAEEPKGPPPKRPSTPEEAVAHGYRDNRARESIEANLGANTESNFYVGFSGQVQEGGVFIATYNILPKGTPVRCLITLPGGLSTQVEGYVRFVRDPMDFTADSEPGMGVAFERLSEESRALVLRFIRKRPPMFYDE